MRASSILALLLGLVALGACTAASPTSPLATPPGASSGPPDPSKLPPAAASDLGQPCSGFGTGFGETALFPDDDCGAGSCLVDARDAMDLYCSVDCTKAACPSGYTCAAVDHPHGGYACFRDESDGTTPNPEPDGDTDGGLGAAATNPDGVPYPTDHLGWKARKGSTRGERMQNLAFVGYAPSSTKQRTISLADFYDPTGTRHDVVWLVAGSLWDTFTQAALRAAHDAQRRIAVVAVLGEGTQPATAATLADLGTFRSKVAWATTALDSGFALLKPAFDYEAVPVTIVLDARTMEITQSGAGSVTIAAQVEQAVDAITSRPPSY